MKIILALIALCVNAVAGVQVHSVTIPQADRQAPIMSFGTTGFLYPSIPLTFPAFDTSLGTLTDVQIVTAYSPTWNFRCENESMSPAIGVSWSDNHNVLLAYRPADVANVPVDFSRLFGQGNGMPSLTVPGFVGNLAAYDGTTDFGGTSGVTMQPYVYTYSPTVSSHANSFRELAFFSEPVPTRTVFLCPRMVGQYHYGFPGHWRGEHQIDMNFNSLVLIRYTYQ